MSVDVEMQGFDDLPRHYRAWALVGYYLSHFAFLEHQIDLAFENLLDIGPVPSIVISSNMGMVEKLRVLRSLTDMVFAKDEAGKRVCQSALKEILEVHLQERNTVAHNTFSPTENAGGGVKFMTARAASTLKFAQVHWTTRKFVERVKRFAELEAELRRIMAEADKTRFQDFMRAKTPEEVAAITKSMRTSDKQGDQG